MFSGNVPIPYGGSVELMEIDTNTTLIGGLESQNGSISGGHFAGSTSIMASKDLTSTLSPAPWPT